MGHTSFPYTSRATDTWDALEEADADPADPADVWLIYADRSTNGAQEYNSGQGWTREHLWPQSLAQYEADSNDVPATDLHALRAALRSCNSHRSNHVFGAVPHTDWAPSHVDCPMLMCDPSLESGVCEPHDKIKGEIARALMYMALRYDGHNDVSALSGAENWVDLRLNDVAIGGEALLTSWSDAHPPGGAEIARDATIREWQGFGNPFVSDPTLTRCRFDAPPSSPPPPSPSTPMPRACLLLTGVFDGPLPGGLPKGIELSATCDIPDLTRYGLGVANNGGGTDSMEYNLGAGSLSAGAFMYVSSEADRFEEFFGFAPSATSGKVAVNGDDAIELFLDDTVVDTFGEIDTDGTNRPWVYSDGWAYRVSGTGPDGATFQRASWAFSGANALDNAATNAFSLTPMPIGQYA